MHRQSSCKIQKVHPCRDSHPSKFPRFSNRFFHIFITLLIFFHRMIPITAVLFRFDADHTEEGLYFYDCSHGLPGEFSFHFLCLSGSVLSGNGLSVSSPQDPSLLSLDDKVTVLFISQPHREIRPFFSMFFTGFLQKNYVFFYAEKRESINFSHDCILISCC